MLKIVSTLISLLCVALLHAPMANAIAWTDRGHSTACTTDATRSGGTIVMGHRGAGVLGTHPFTNERPDIDSSDISFGAEPENTMAAFKRAYALGVQLVELDVQLTRTAVVHI
jgi:glycerophosphoryl diester phosphodiesterase